MRSLAVLPLFIPSIVIAQQQAPDTARVDPVVVTATRAPLTRNALPVAVTIITGDELRVRGITSVADALQDVSGASVIQMGSPGATTSLFLRGGESKYVKVLIDGVPANDPGGTYDYASLTTDNVERIEIVRGPASVVHGADAVTGVINVITKRGTAVPQGEVRVSTGVGERTSIDPTQPDPRAYNASDASVSLAGAPAEALSYAVALARHQSSGLYDLNNDYRNNVLSARLGFAARRGTDMRFTMRYVDYQYNYPTSGGGDVVDSNAFRVDDRMILGVEVDHRLADRARVVVALSSSVNNGGTDDREDAAGGSSFVSQDRIRRRGADARVQFTPAAGAFTLGASMEQQDQRSQSQSVSSFGTFLSEFRAGRRNLAGYGEGVVSLLPQLTATVGARVDDNEQFGTFATGRAGLSWRALPAVRLRLTYGNAFREPSFAENYSTGFVVGNPALEPERATTWDGGVDADLLGGRARVSLTGFAQRFTSMIDYEPTATACGYSYCNVAVATSNGIEVEGSARVWGPLHAGIAATFLRTRVEDPGFDASSGGLYKEGESLIRRPERKIVGDVSFRGAGPLRASMRVLAVGVRTDRDFRPFPAVPVILASYERVDLGAEYAITSRQTITARVENLCDERYENAFNFLTPRRTISLGIRSTF